MPAPYRWIITHDYIDGGKAQGTTGPSNADPSIKTNSKAFVMKDGDGEMYYRGRIYGAYDGFEPLDQFGTPNAGATEIWIDGAQV